MWLEVWLQRDSGCGFWSGWHVCGCRHSPHCSSVIHHPVDLAFTIFDAAFLVSYFQNDAIRTYFKQEIWHVTPPWANKANNRVITNLMTGIPMDCDSLKRSFMIDLLCHGVSACNPSPEAIQGTHSLTYTLSPTSSVSRLRLFRTFEVAKVSNQRSRMCRCRSSRSRRIPVMLRGKYDEKP